MPTIIDSVSECTDINTTGAPPVSRVFTRKPDAVSTITTVPSSCPTAKCLADFEQAMRLPRNPSMKGLPIAGRTLTSCSVSASMITASIASALVSPYCMSTNTSDSPTREAGTRISITDVGTDLVARICPVSPSRTRSVLSAQLVTMRPLRVEVATHGIQAAIPDEVRGSGLPDIRANALSLVRTIIRSVVLLATTEVALRENAVSMDFD